MNENAVCKGRKCFFTKASIDRLRHYVYNIHNFTECDEREAKLRAFSESCRSVRGSRAVRRSAPELQMMNLTGTPDTAVQVGRKASWVATREYNSRL